MEREFFTVAGPFDDDLVASVGQAVLGAVAQDGASKRLSHSSTARLLVMTKLEARCRWSTSSKGSAECLGVNRWRPRSSRMGRVGFTRPSDSSSHLLGNR